MVENNYTRSGIQVSEWVGGWVGWGGCGGGVGCSHSTVTTPTLGSCARSVHIDYSLLNSAC